MEEHKFKFIPNKKSVDIDGHLYFLANSFANTVIEQTEVHDPELIHVATIQMTTMQIPNNSDYFVKFDFVLSNEQLEQIDYENNLDSLIDYDEGFNAPISIVFGLLECIRTHYQSDVTYMVGEDLFLPTQIYMVNNKD